MPSSLGYDIFRKLEDGGAMWVGDALTLDQAKQKLRSFLATKPGAYLLRDATTGEIVSAQGGLEELDGECA